MQISWFKNYKTFFKLSVKVILYITLKRIKLHTILLHLDSILAKISGGFAPKPSLRELATLPHTSQLSELVTNFSWITSEKIIQTLNHIIRKKAYLLFPKFKIGNSEGGWSQVTFLNTETPTNQF